MSALRLMTAGGRFRLINLWTFGDERDRITQTRRAMAVFEAEEESACGRLSEHQNAVNAVLQCSRPGQFVPFGEMVDEQRRNVRG